MTDAADDDAESALAMPAWVAALIPGARLHEPAAGHIGMAAGSGAERVLWERVSEWLAAAG